MGFKLSKSFGWSLARDSNLGAGVRPPAGYAFIANTDGSYVTDANGNYKVRPL